MKKSFIAIAMAALVAGGVLVYLATQGNQDSQTNQTPAEQTPGATFAPVATTDLAFTADFTSQSGATTTKATVKYNGSGTWSYQTTSGSDELEVILTNNAYYSKTGGKWYKLPVADNEGSQGFDTSLYTYDADKLSALRGSAGYQGTQSCVSGTCHVWESTSGDTKTSVYIDSTTNRISEVKVASPQSTSAIVYTWGKVSISVPTSAQSLPTAS